MEIQNAQVRKATCYESYRTPRESMFLDDLLTTKSITRQVDSTLHRLLCRPNTNSANNEITRTSLFCLRCSGRANKSLSCMYPSCKPNYSACLPKSKCQKYSKSLRVSSIRLSAACSPDKPLWCSKETVQQGVDCRDGCDSGVLLAGST